MSARNWFGFKCRLGYCGGRPQGEMVWRCDECGKGYWLTEEDRAVVRRMLDREAATRSTPTPEAPHEQR